jgi:DNA polymerase III subunit gamma/tau
MSYHVLARKWRPKNFAQLIGQEHVVRALVNGLSSGRLHHAFLFTGTRGVGKTTIARIIAKALNCDRGVSAEPCGQCSACLDIDAGRYVDLLEIDAASRTKVDDTREILDNIMYAPSRGRFKVYLIDEVHMLSNHSFNALLKTLEEPPEHVKFVLATTDPQKLPVTVLSRCLKFHLKRLSVDQIAGQMQTILSAENIEFDTDALEEIARAADGSMRDGLSLLDQAIAFGAGAVRTEPTREMLGTVAGDTVDQLLLSAVQCERQKLLAALQEFALYSPNYVVVMGQMLERLHRASVQQIDAVAGAHATVVALAHSSPEQLQLAYQIILAGVRDVQSAPDARVAFEMVMLRLLSFTPWIIADNATPGVPVKTASTPVTSKPIAVVQPLGAVIKNDRSSSPPIAEPVALEKVTSPAPLAASVRTASVIADDLTGRWLDIIEQGSLRGPLRELAVNMAPAKWNEEEIHLVLPTSHEIFNTERARAQLGEAVQMAIGQPVKLVISNASALNDTPALRIEAAREQKQMDAENRVANDPIVHALKQDMGARVVAGSVRILN